MRLIVTAMGSLATALVLAPAAMAVETGAVPTEHFVVHYYKDTVPYRVSDQTALQVANDAERAYDKIVGEWGFPAPVADNSVVNGDRRRGFAFWGPTWWDGKIDIRIVRIRNANGVAYRASAVDDQTPGMISLNSAVATNRTTVAHELFHLVQFAIFAHAVRDRMLAEGTATWAAAQIYPETTRLPFSIARPWVSLDCRSACGAVGRPGGYEHWSFFQFLSERHGVQVIRDIFERARQLGSGDNKPHAIEAMSAALKARGTSFTRAFNDYWAANISGNYAHPALKGKHPALVGVLSASKRRGDSERVRVDRLAAKAIRIRLNKPGCKARRVSLQVSLPPGARSRPMLDFSRSGLEQIERHGSGARTILRWRPCKRGRSALLVLPNASPSLDDREFRVRARLRSG